SRRAVSLLAGRRHLASATLHVTHEAIGGIDGRMLRRRRRGEATRPTSAKVTSDRRRFSSRSRRRRHPKRITLAKSDLLLHEALGSRRIPQISFVRHLFYPVTLPEWPALLPEKTALRPQAAPVAWARQLAGPSCASNPSLCPVAARRQPD